jgi:hypothetical protein
MSQNVWATIMPFGPVTNFLLAQKKIFVPANAALISGTEMLQKIGVQLKLRKHPNAYIAI